MILTRSYIRRKRWEAKVTAAAIGQMLAGAVGSSDNAGVNTPVNPGQAEKYITLANGKRAKVVSPDFFIKTVQGGL